MQGIYKITNIINNHLYIGKTKDFDRRWKDHKRLAFTSNHKEYNKTLYQAIRKYGIENFSFEILEIIENYSIAEEREKYWISFFDSYNNGYNETPGGDGGSQKGHCLGEHNGRAKLTKEDVIFIRTKYTEGIGKSQCYEYVKDKISLGGFAKVWNGQSWKEIMPEVYTEENKKRNTSLGRATASLNNRLFTREEILDIRKMDKEGYSLKQICEKYNKASKSCIADIYYNRTYKEIQYEAF